MTSFGHFKDKIYTYPIRIYYEDTDSGQVVYHANYLKFAERARTEFLRGLGFSQTFLCKTHNLKFVVSECRLQCIVPAYLDDFLCVQTYLVSAKGARLTMRQKIYRDEQKIAQVDVILACINSLSKPFRINTEVYNKLLPYLLTME